MSSSSPPVLIVGAGPTGLLLAASLQQHNIDVRLIDKRTQPRPTSRAFTVHARTIELLDTLGAAELFVNDGIHSKGFIFNFKGKESRPTLNFTNLNTLYPYVLIIKQNHTEDKLREILQDRFGIATEWGSKLVSLELKAGKSKAIVEKREGDSNEAKEDVLHPLWVVGCDGAYSTVRDAINVDFSGAKYENTAFEMMDTKIDNYDGDSDWIHYYMSKDSFLLISKLHGDQNHRILVSRMSDSVDRSMSQLEQFQTVVDMQLPGTNLNEPAWATRWQLWKRLADRYRKDSVFVAGDAAHVHSPSGGQGMNVGLQDAFNLGWKLAFVLKGYAKPGLLDSYEIERKPIGEQVIAGTSAMHNIIMAHGKGIQDRLKQTESPGWHDEAVHRISGLSYHYRGTALPSFSYAGNDTNKAVVLPGERMPLMMRVSASKNLADLLRLNTKLIFLLLSGGVDIKKAETHIIASFGEFSQVHSINTSECGLFGEEGRGYVVRPDGYLLLSFDVERVREAISGLKCWFIAKSDVNLAST